MLLVKAPHPLAQYLLAQLLLAQYLLAHLLCQSARQREPRSPPVGIIGPPLRAGSLPGLTLALNDITDMSSGTNGMRAAHGIRTHTDLNATLDLEKFMGWRGATLFAQHKMKRGANGSGAAGLMQSHSNIDAEDFRAAGEVWLEQRLWNDVLRLKAGRLDFNTEFAGTDNGSAFLNASMGYSPAIAAAPTFPLPITAFNVIVTPREGSQLSVGAFDGRDGAPAAADGVSRFYIGQMSQSWSGGAHAFDGRVSLGAWRHTGMFMASDADDSAEPSIHGTGGWYGTVDVTLWRGTTIDTTSGDAPTAALFAQVGRGNARVASVDMHRGMGVVTTGVVPHRHADQLGVGITRATWVGGRETISEAFYQAPITAHLTLVADVQRVGHFDVLGRRTGFIPALRTIVSF